MLKLYVGGNKTRQYIVWVYLDSKQVKINGHPYGNIEINKSMIGSFVPSPYEEMSEDLKEIISGKRYTVKVE